MTAAARNIIAIATFAVLGDMMTRQLWAQTPHSINLIGGQAIHPGVRGQNVPNLGGDSIYHQKTLDLTNNASIRGVAGGLAADSYNWKNRTGFAVGDPGLPGPPMLEYLRYARDHDAELFVTVNARGTGTGVSSSDFVYTDTSLAPLSTLAADWVRYANLIAPAYKQGDSLPTGDANLVNSLQWGSHDRLRGASEAATKKVTYWEIGNEPDIGIVDANDPSGSGGYALTPDEYADRYVAISQAMRAVDPTIKLGPVVKRGINDAGAAPDPWLMEVLSRSNAQVDFISYHPYTALFTEYINGGDVPSIPVLEERLRYIRPKQQSEYQLVRDAIQENNDDSFFGIFGPIRNLNTPVVASEWNPGHWPVGGMYVGRSMAQALASAETVFTFAQNQNMIASQYWLWPVSYFEGAEIPVYKAFQGLRDHMGDTLVDVVASDNVRLYTTKNSDTGEIVLWGLNFSDDTAQTLQLSLDNLSPGQDYSITLMRLANITGGDTSLMSYTSASASEIQSIDWLTSDLTGQINLANFSLTLDDATITALVIQPVPEAGCLSALLLLEMSLLHSRRIVGHKASPNHLLSEDRTCAS